MTIRTLSAIDWQALTARRFTPSPAAWEDQVFYFLMLDRFSDGREDSFRDNDGNVVTTGTTPLFRTGDAGNTDPGSWERAGNGWCGGTLKGLESKLGYLSRLGITAIWISPLFKQVSFQSTYHGYGVQDFLAVDPHFGTAQDLKRLVERAHAMGIFVILDVILNHAGNVFSYNPNRHKTMLGGVEVLDPRWDGMTYDVAGFNDASGRPALSFPAPGGAATPDDAVWPEEFQRPGTFTCKGRISNWDHDPEFREGDFCDLKDIGHGSGEADHYHVSAALTALAECCKYWIALADVDGFRIDTVKHMDVGATRYFASVIREFTQTLGKERFFLLGEITGGRERAFKTLAATGLDAALGVDDIPDKMEYLVKGCRNPVEYFNLFRNSLLLEKESHVWFRDKVVTMFDDHDQVRKGRWKARFCAHDRGGLAVLNVMALNATTLGIPCVYYGSEQYFNGAASVEKDGNDVLLRECMFGGSFGSFRSSGRHFFDESSPAYRELAKVLEIRRSRLTLRRGRQYLREISGNGTDFGLPCVWGTEIRSVVGWSRIFDRKETVAAVNTDFDHPSTAWVTVDAGLHAPGDALTCIYSTDQAQIGRSASVVAANGLAVQITVPPAGFVLFE